MRAHSVVDNFDNSSPESLARVREITGCADDDLILVEIDLCDEDAVEKLVRSIVPSGLRWRPCLDERNYR